MGPITLFDKSFLEMLNVDEAALFDALFSANICPIFYTEVLADLDKMPPGERSQEKIVQENARHALHTQYIPCFDLPVGTQRPRNRDAPRSRACWWRARKARRQGRCHL
jgi:hypothetical protein